MNGLFKGNAEINADLSDWDVSQVTDIREMFRDAVNFNQHLKDWKLSSSVTSEDAFAGAISFQAKFTNCTSATNGPPSSCELKRRMNRLEFAEYVSTQRSAFMNTKVIVTDEVWATFDTNGDGDLDDAEYARANRLMRYGYVSGTPWLVYSSKEMKNIRSFDVIRPKVSGNEPIKISADGAAETKSFLPCDAEVDKDGYYLIFKHDSSEGDFWLNSDEAKHFGVSPSTEKSIQGSTKSRNTASLVHTAGFNSNLNIRKKNNRTSGAKLRIRLRVRNEAWMGISQFQPRS
jgi:surface protein